jgi:hypothetical protein
MTYTTLYLGSLDKLKEELKKHPENIKYYMKYMGVNGPTESVDYLNKKIEEFLKNNQ